MLFWLYSS